MNEQVDNTRFGTRRRNLSNLWCRGWNCLEDEIDKVKELLQEVGTGIYTAGQWTPKLAPPASQYKCCDCVARWSLSGYCWSCKKSDHDHNPSWQNAVWGHSGITIQGRLDYLVNKPIEILEIVFQVVILGVLSFLFSSPFFAQLFFYIFLYFPRVLWAFLSYSYISDLPTHGLHELLLQGEGLTPIGHWSWRSPTPPDGYPTPSPCQHHDTNILLWS